MKSDLNLEPDESEKVEICRFLKELISINSSASEPAEGSPFGTGIADCLGNIIEIGNRWGLTTRNENHYAYLECGEGAGMVALVGHVDTVALGNGWSYGPLAAQVVDGVLYGRGAIDNKGPVVSALYALKKLKELGVSGCRYRLILETDEEIGFRGLAKYLQCEEEPDFAFVVDSHHTVCCGEMGIAKIEVVGKTTSSDGTFRIRALEAGNQYSSVPDVCTAVLEFVSPQAGEALLCKKHGNITCSKESENSLSIQARGRAAHLSRPEGGRNAIDEMFGFLSECRIPIVEWYEKNVRGGESADWLKSKYPMQRLGPLSISCGAVISAGDEIKCSLDVRYPDVILIKNIYKKLLLDARNFELCCDLKTFVEPYWKELDSALVEIALRVYRRNMNGGEIVPTYSRGSTLARVFKNAIAVGVSLSQDDRGAHEANESIALSTLFKNVRIFSELMLESAKLASERTWLAVR
jgi:succinyl-diaminopimelate desuccinylase